MPDLRVEIVGGPGAGARYDVGSTIEIGRADVNGIVLADDAVSSRHIRLTPAGDGIDVEDLGSTNGTWVNQTRLSGPVHLTSGYEFTVGMTTFHVLADDAPRASTTAALAQAQGTISIGFKVQVQPPSTAAPGSGDLTDELLHTSQWTDDMVQRAGIPVVDVPIVSVGGGIGSFVFVDFLRIAGLPLDQVKVLTRLDYPWQNYEYLTGVSQIPPTEILRSDSASTPDNIWGFPGYAWRGVFNKQNRPAGTAALAPMWNVLTENIFCDYWTPPAGLAFRSMQKEADRINYWPVVEKGQVRMVRKRVGGGYYTIFTPPAGSTPTKRVAYRSTYAHIAVGYPGLRFLDDLQEYRQKYEDTHRVVNAYEPHEHVYEELNHRQGGKVVVRGAGIVASRILQRLCDDREKYGNNVEILHLFRSYFDKSDGPNIFLRRKAAHGWQYQGFNFPKGSWGGVYKFRIDKLEGEKRKELFDIMGGTTTPKRRLWIKQLAKGRGEGWYREFVGRVLSFEPTADGNVNTTIEAKNGDHLVVDANFVIDCTGLEADIAEHRLFADLLEHSGAGRNVLNKLSVGHSFDVRGCENPPGQMYAVGSSTLGSYYAVVDTFLGLQYAALQVTDDLARRGVVKKIGVGRSVSQWFRWARHKTP